MFGVCICEIRELRFDLRMEMQRIEERQGRLGVTHGELEDMRDIDEHSQDFDGLPLQLTRKDKTSKPGFNG